MKHISADICVIGAGSGGLSVAAGAVQMGASVVLFEADKMGGDCLNTGCVPSKALLAAAKAAHYAKGAPAMGVAAHTPTLSFADAKAHVASAIATIEPHDSIERFTSLGVTVINEAAQFTGPRTVASATHKVTARYVVVATGSTAFVPPITGLDSVPYHTNESIFSQPNCPDHLVIIGGGPIGVEMAQAHRRLGAKVTIIEAATIMGRDDPELVALLRQSLTDDGIALYEGRSVTAVAGTEGALTVTLDDGQTIAASHILVAVGRQPNVTSLNLDAAQIAHSPTGIRTDARLRTSNKRVFAIGDVTGRAQFTHIAAYHAGIVIRNILFKLPAKLNETIEPRVTYCDPELAHVGMDEASASAQFGPDAIRVLRAPLSGNDRAIAEGKTHGMVKVITHKNGRILGASILAPAAGEMITAWTLALSTKQKIASMASLITPYPTYGDASKRAAGSFFTDKLFSSRTRAVVKFLMRF